MRKGALSVDGALPGREDEIRFFLEAVILQANADQDVTDEDEPDAPEAHPDQQSEMTDRFRRFAEEESQ